MSKKINSFFKTYAVVFLLLLTITAKGNIDKAVQTSLHHAQTYYWLGIQDKGDPAAFKMALSFLELAKDELDTSASDIDPDKKQSYLKQIELLESDLKEQLAIAQNTFVGRFPLVRFMGKSIFISSKALGSFEIFEEPGEVAMARSADKLGGLFYNHFFGELQLPLLVFSEDDLFPELESKVRVILKNSPRIKVYQTQYLRKYFSDDELSQMQKGKPDSLLLAGLSKILKADNFAIATIRKVDQINDIHFYSLSTQVFSSKSQTPLQSTVLYELVRDKRYLIPLYLLSILALFILSTSAYFINFKKHTGKYPDFGKVLGISSLAFFIGFLTSIIALGVFYNLRPDYLDYFAYTFWWIPAAMLIIFIAPLFILKKYILNLPIFQSAEDSSSRLSPVFLAASMGVLAYLSLGLILYHGVAGFLFVSGGALSIGISVFIAGKVFAPIKPIPFFLVVLSLLIIPITGLALASYNIQYMLIPVLGSLSLILPLKLKSLKKSGAMLSSVIEDRKSITIKQFITLTENPPYIKTQSYEAAKSKVNLHIGSQSVIICLKGDEGTGKTAMAHQLIAEFRTVNKGEQNKPLLLLDAQCPENNDSPYLPIQSALADYINFMGSDSSGQQGMQDIENALDKLVGSFVPFSSLLKSSAKTKAAGINSQSELFFMITKTLEKLSHHYQLIFFIDDLHWADNASIDLLNNIHQHFRKSTSKKALFLYTSRPSDPCSFLFQEHEVQSVELLSHEEKFSLLTKSMGVEIETARFLLDYLGSQNRRGNLFLTYKILEQLAREGHLKENLNGIALTDETLQSGKLPIPDEYKETLRQELNKLEQYEEYIAVAACMGMEFEVGVLAQALGVDRLKCLKVLKFLENETSILADKPEKDDVFAFTSSFTLETIREILALNDHGPNELVKQIVREYHARIATSLERKDAEGNILRIASHYYAAGQNYAETALRFLIKAADSCADIFRFEEARSFLKKAAVEKRYSKDQGICELDILLVECKISMLEGKQFELTAQKCQNYLINNPHTDDLHKLIFARAYYNARRFDDVLAVAKEIIDNSNDDFILARAYHLRGISLDFGLTTERLQSLDKSLELLGKQSEKDTDILRAMAEIHNSLGEEITKSAKYQPGQKELADKHFKESIKIKELKEISDTPGLARTYGGLGRLEMYIQPTNIPLALDYFVKDLELSEQIGDVLGQTQMNSNIGKCYILMGRYEKAGPAYQRSLELAERPMDRVFALLGLLQVNDHTNWFGSREEIAKKLEETLSVEGFGVPSFLKEEITLFIETAKNKSSLEKIQRILGAM